LQSAVVLSASRIIGTRLVRRLAEAGNRETAVVIVPPLKQMNGVTYVTADVH